MKFKKVMVVDDQRIMHKALRVMLARLGCPHVIVASSSVEALERARLEEPDLAIVDIFLGHNDSGLDLTRALRAQHPTLTIGVMSGALDTKLALASIEASANWFLCTPFDAETLRETMARGGVPAATIPSLQPELRLDATKKGHVVMVLRMTRGNISKAAKLLGLARASLQQTLRRWGLTIQPLDRTQRDQTSTRPTLDEANSAPTE